MVLKMCCFFTKSIIRKQFEYSRIKRLCIFHVTTVRGLSGSGQREGFYAVYGASGQRGSPPGYAPASSVQVCEIHCVQSLGILVHKAFPRCAQVLQEMLRVQDCSGAICHSVLL